MMSRGVTVTAVNPLRQRGVALIVTMVFLIILTYLGISTIQDTNLEEKMASNLYHSNNAFQSAEAVLRDGEDRLTNATLPPFDNTDGFFDESYDLNSFIGSSASWDSCSGWQACQTFAGVKTGYVIQEMPAINTDDSLEAGTPQDTERYYRVTAKAESINTAAVVVLQSTYRR